MKRYFKGDIGRRGTAVVEFGLALPLLALLFMGIFQYGYTIWVYNRLVTAVKNGAVMASRLDYDGYASGAAFTTQVRNMVVFGDPNGGGRPLAPNLSTGNVVVTSTKDILGLPKIITVRISGYRVSAVVRTYTFERPTLSVRYMGSYHLLPGL